MSELIGYLSEVEHLEGELTIPKQLGGSTLGTKTITENDTYYAEDDGLDGYSEVTVNVSGGDTPVLETITKTYTPTESQQTEQITAGSGYDAIEEVDVTVNAIPSSYVGSGVARKSSSDLTDSGATVNVPAGYYESAASKAVASGTEGTPTATKGAVSNHSVAVTPSVTNQAGYIAGGTKTGTAVTVSASELDSGTKSITANGTNQDVVGYAAVDVAVPNSYSAADEGKVVSSGALVAQTAHADVTPTTSDQTIDTTTNNSIKVKGDADLVAANIKKDIEIFGVTGSYEGGGGGSDESGSFIASSPLDSVTIPVSSKKSCVEFWIHGLNGNMDLSGTPYGTNQLVYFYANDALQINTKGQVNYAGTAFTGGFNTSSSGAQNGVVFQDDRIVISGIRVNGSNRPMVDGATYDWRAW